MYTEEIIQYGSNSNNYAIITQDSRNQEFDRPCIIFINAGLIHHVGPNRIHVIMSRIFTKFGFTSVRFDFSLSKLNHNKYQTDTISGEYINELMNLILLLEDQIGVDKFVLIGICSGGDVAIQAIHENEKIVGASTFNPLIKEVNYHEGKLRESDETQINQRHIKPYKLNLDMLKNEEKKISILFSTKSNRYKIFNKAICYDFFKGHTSDLVSFGLVNNVDDILTPSEKRNAFIEYNCQWLRNNFK